MTEAIISPIKITSSDSKPIKKVVTPLQKIPPRPANGRMSPQHVRVLSPSEKKPLLTARQPLSKPTMTKLALHKKPAAGEITKKPLGRPLMSPLANYQKMAMPIRRAVSPTPATAKSFKFDNITTVGGAAVSGADCRKVLNELKEEMKAVNGILKESFSKVFSGTYYC